MRPYQPDPKRFFHISDHHGYLFTFLSGGPKLWVDPPPLIAVLDVKSCDFFHWRLSFPKTSISGNKVSYSLVQICIKYQNTFFIAGKLLFCLSYSKFKMLLLPWMIIIWSKNTLLPVTYMYLGLSNPFLPLGTHTYQGRLQGGTALVLCENSYVHRTPFL